MLPQVDACRRRALMAALGLGLLMVVGLVVLGRTLPSFAQAASDVTISKTANPTNVTPGQQVTYTVTFTNSGSIAYDVVMSDIIPYGTSYVIGSVSSTPPGAGFSTGPDRVEWIGVAFPGQTTVTTFRVLVHRPSTAGPLPIPNRACVRYTSGLQSWRRCASATVYSRRQAIYLPFVMRNYESSLPWPWVQSGSPR